MKKYSMLVLAMICTVLTGAFGGCKKGNPSGVSDGEYVLPEKSEIAATGVNLVENGMTEYTVVIPSTSDFWINTAYSEFALFISHASGVEIPVCVDTAVTYDESKKYISLGNTVLFEESDLTLTKDLGDTGYLLERKGNMLLCNANASYGVLYGVYDLLGYSIGFESYAEDEIYYEKTSTVPLLDYHIKFIPTIDYRFISYLHLNQNATYAQRMRLFNKNNVWMSWAHTTVQRYLKPAVYGTSNPEFYGTTATYSDKDKQICYANQGALEEMAKNVIAELNANPTKSFVMIGHEDNMKMCTCEECEKARVLFGGYGGQELDFTNRLSDYIKEKLPDREFNLCFFAYTTSQDPPAVKIGDSYVPAKIGNDGKLTACEKDENGYILGERDGKKVYLSWRDNVYVMYAPIDVDFSKPLTDEINQKNCEQMSGWSDIMKLLGAEENMVVYTYSIAQMNVFVPLNNFGISESHYQIFSDFGAKFVYDQAFTHTEIPCFQALKVYTQSKMMYDNKNNNYNELVEDFHKHYYDDASEEMLDYYKFFRSYYQYLTETKGLDGYYDSYSDIIEFWPVDVLQKLISILDGALEKIEPLKETNVERYTVLCDRINREKLTPIWLMFKHYMNAMTQETKEEYIELLMKYTKQYDILLIGEHDPNLLAQINTWRNAIYG